MIVFVGDKPSSKMKPGARPFEGASCEPRLYEWLNTLLGPQDLFKIINQCDYAYANLYAVHIRDKVKYVALGNNASDALGKIPHFKLPHPSGMNRQINNKEFIEKKLKECRSWLNETQT